MYDPTVGRFISLDPIGFEAGDTNLSRYVANTPTNATDPTGEVLRLRKGISPPALEEGEIVLFFGHYVPTAEFAPERAAATSGIHSADEIGAALQKMAENGKGTLPDNAFVAAVGCFPQTLRREVDAHFPGRWLPARKTICAMGSLILLTTFRSPLTSFKPL